jgi:Protein of unknown function (DUF3102)
MSNELIPCGFNYAALSGDDAQLARDTAQKLRNWQRRTAAAIIDIGSDLLRVKAVLGHGHYTSWLAAEFPHDKRTAQLFMQVAARLTGKSETVSHLPAKTLYRLTAKSTPDNVVADVIAACEHGAESDAVEKKLDDIREAKRQDEMRLLREKRLRRLTKKQREERKNQERERAQAEERAVVAARKAAADLLNEIGLPVVKQILCAPYRVLAALEEFIKEFPNAEDAAIPGFPRRESAV